MSVEIRIRNECPRITVSERGLKKIAAKILKDLGFKKAVLSVLLVGSPRMRALNKRYLRHAWSTDVLAFSERKPAARSRRKLPACPIVSPGDFLGDLALCLSTIRSQAREYGHSFEEELHYCLCHGILHLLGHDDKTRSGFKKMHWKQKRILKRVSRKDVKAKVR